LPRGHAADLVERALVVFGALAHGLAEAVHAAQLRVATVDVCRTFGDADLVARVADSPEWADLLYRHATPLRWIAALAGRRLAVRVRVAGPQRVRRAAPETFARGDLVGRERVGRRPALELSTSTGDAGGAARAVRAGRARARAKALSRGVEHTVVLF